MPSSESMPGEPQGRLSADETPTFIDLFAGIGGTRLALEMAGARCILSSENDRFALETYQNNHDTSAERVVRDVREITGADPVENVPGRRESNPLDLPEVPAHDILVAGFPCQPFSLAGVSKRNSLGRAHGFECRSQGTLFHEIEKILGSNQRPRAFLLENVKNLRSHDAGRTYKHITQTLNALGYRVFDRVLDGARFTPQHRERIFFVGFLRDEFGRGGDVDFSWEEIKTPDVAPRLVSILHREDGSEPPEPPYTLGEMGAVNPRYTLSPSLWSYLQAYAEKHRSEGHGFGFGLVGPNDVARTLSARYYKDGSEILVDRGPGELPRRLTPRECARLMGFPASFQPHPSDSRAYRQFGNSVVVPLVAEIARLVVAALRGASPETVPLQRAFDLQR